MVSNFTALFATSLLALIVTMNLAAAEKKEAAEKPGEKLVCVEKGSNGRWYFQSCRSCIEKKKDCEIYDPKKHSSKMTT